MTQKQLAIVQEDILKSYYYNPETGLLYRKLANKLKLTGCESNGHLSVTIKSRNFLVHQVIWLYMTGEWPDGFIDHIDGNRKNNKWDNLRVGSNSENMQNLKTAKANNKSTGKLGVTAQNDKFIARITLNGCQTYLGTFDTLEDAQQAYIEAKRNLHSFNTL